MLKLQTVGYDTSSAGGAEQVMWDWFGAPMTAHGCPPTSTRSLEGFVENPSPSIASVPPARCVSVPSVETLVTRAGADTMSVSLEKARP